MSWSWLPRTTLSAESEVHAGGASTPATPASETAYMRRELEWKARWEQTKDKVMFRMTNFQCTLLTYFLQTLHRGIAWKAYNRSNMHPHYYLKCLYFCWEITVNKEKGCSLKKKSVGESASRIHSCRVLGGGRRRKNGWQTLNQVGYSLQGKWNCAMK